MKKSCQVAGGRSIIQIEKDRVAWLDVLKALLNDHVFVETEPMTLLGWRSRLAFGVLFVAWCVSIWAMPLTKISQMLHLTVILFHETGHIFFSPFGEVMRVAGGTLGQLLMPLICCLALRRNGDAFGAGVAFSWMGLSFMDASVYAYDAFDPVLPLIGGGTGADSFHDFVFLFDHFEQEAHSRSWASAMNTAGSLVMFAGLTWSARSLLHAVPEVETES